MRRINKSEEPQSLRSFNKAKHENWTEISDPANRHVYNDCWQQCFEDQACLCSYTEAPLPKDKEKDKDEDEVKVKRHIDHYIKRDFAPDLTFCWNNMIAAVKDSRFGADYKDKHVKRNDYDKSECCYTDILNPVKDEFAGRFRFSADGTIEPSDSQDIKAEKTIELFNLNEKSLKERRKVQMENVRTYIEDGWAKEEIPALLKERGFVSAIEYELSQIDD